jgi:hypothetical protein
MSKKSENHISLTRLAHLLGVSKNTAISWRREGMPIVRAGGGGRTAIYDVEACKRWRTERDANRGSELAESKAAYAHERARASIIEADFKSGLTISRAELIEAKQRLSVDFYPESLASYLSWRACQVWIRIGDQEPTPEADAREFIEAEIGKLIGALHRPLKLSNDVVIDPRDVHHQMVNVARDAPPQRVSMALPEQSSADLNGDAAANHLAARIKLLWADTRLLRVDSDRRERDLVPTAVATAEHAAACKRAVAHLRQLAEQLVAAILSVPYEVDVHRMRLVLLPVVVAGFRNLDLAAPEPRHHRLRHKADA